MKSICENKKLVPEVQDFPVLSIKRSKDVLSDISADALPQMICIKSQGTQLSCNQAMQDYLGTDQQKLSTSDFLQNKIHPNDREKILNLWKKSSDHLPGQQLCRIRNTEHGYRWFSVSVSFPAQKHPRYELIMSCADIHDIMVQQMALHEQIFEQNQMLDASVDCIKIISIDGRVDQINQVGRIALGIPENTTQFGMSWLKLLAPSVRKSGQRALNAAAQGKRSRFNGISQMPGEDAQYWDNILTPVLNQYGQTKNILCVSRDISQQRRAEERLYRMNDQDDLTGLYNRRAFRKILSKHLQQSRKTGTSTALLLLDLDYFKLINDSLGYVAGDHLLRVLSKRLQNCLAGRAIVSRLGSDEFSIILPRVESEQDILDVAALLHKQLDTPIRYNGQYLNGSMSIGCTLFPRDARDTSSLMKCADIALNDLKTGGRGGIRMFSQSMLDVLEESARQLILARQLIRSQRIFPFYQPKVLLSTEKLVGFEALMRWKDEDGNVQPPTQIQKSFQDYDLATHISEQMQTLIFQDIAGWLKQGLTVLPISINAAPVEFLRDNYAEKLLKRMQQFNIPSHLIEIEFTELSLAEGGGPSVSRALNVLKKAGLRISLDDFGTGHSSLTRLKDFPVDCIKIDRSFITDMQNDSSILAIVRAIGQLGPGMSVDILAEGIEVAEQLDTLRDCNCHIGQGYYFYKPMSSSDAMNLLDQFA